MHQIIAKAVAEGRNLLEPEALRLFTDYGLPVPPFRFVKTREEAAQASNDIGYPVVMKIVSPDVLHKSDMGGVKVGRELHDLILDTFGNKTLIEILDKVRFDAQRGCDFASQKADNVMVFLNQHLEIIQALKERDGEKAKLLVNKHIRDAKESVI